MSARNWTALVALVLPTAACHDLDLDPGKGSSEGVIASCACYDTGRLSELFAEKETYALTWDERWRDGLSEVVSLRAYTWSYDAVDGIWESPTFGADAYRDPNDGDQAYCEVWSGTWLAEPVHDWDDDMHFARVTVSDSDFGACDLHLRSWITNQDVVVYTW
jgi:hypothetical protein